MVFINRQVQYPNRKKLNIKEINRGNDGEIEFLVVEEERQEGELTNAGTQIEAETLKTIIKEMIVNMLT